MTVILNTSVSSLTMQKSLTRTSAWLQQSMNRLVTGPQINTAREDPRQAIAAAQRSDQVTVSDAGRNAAADSLTSARQNQMQSLRSALGSAQTVIASEGPAMQDFDSAAETAQAVRVGTMGSASFRLQILSSPVPETVQRLLSG